MRGFADDNLRVTQCVQFCFDKFENIAGKGENAANQHFLLFPQCFQTDLFIGDVKTRACVVKV